MVRSVVLGCGSYLPGRVLTNAELSRMVDTSDEWIAQRTGIRERHIAAEGETTSEMGLKAARAALASHGIHARTIDLIVLATSTPDNTFPASAVSVQSGLGITHGAAFDLQAVCSGFVFGLATVDGLLKTGAFKRALVIGAETFSRILDWNDRATCVLFGDGAGALVLEAQIQPGTREDRGVLTTHLRSDGRHKAKLYVDGGPSSTQTFGRLRMEGRAVFKHAVAMITDKIDGDLARKHNLITDFGKIADPIADKAITGMAFIGLSIVGDIWWWVTIVVLLREWSVTLLRLSVLKSVVIPAAQSGKIKTMLQAVALTGLIMPLPHGDAHGGARGIRLRHVLRHHAVYELEVAEIGEIDVEFRGRVQIATGRHGDGLQVLEHPADLRLHVAPDQLPCRRVERYLTGHVHRAPDPDRLRIGADGLGRRIGRYHFTRHCHLLK